MPKTHSPCIINLDSYKNIGTHWVCCAPSHDNNKTLWYFDLFGMVYPEEFKMKLKKRWYACNLQYKPLSKHS